MRTLYLLIGAPGVGKSTFLEEASKKMYGDDRLLHHVISPDNIRLMVQAPVQNPDGRMGISSNNEKYVWNIIDDIIAKKADKGELIIVDATHSRNRAISSYKKYSDSGYRIFAIDFSKVASIDTILKRNFQREEFKQVPEKVIRTIQARVESLDIPGWVTTITPNEFIKQFQDIKFNFDEFDKLTFIGDIHGCKDELQNLLIKNNLGDETDKAKTAIIFVGDYFDRGYDIPGTFRLLQKIQNEYWVLFLEGNHEQPLSYYKEFMRSITQYLHEWIDSIVDSAYRRDIIERQILHNQYLINKNNAGWAGLVNKIFDPECNLGLQKSLDFGKQCLVDIPMYDEQVITLLKTFRSGSYKQLDAFIENMRAYPEMFNDLKDEVSKYKLPASLVMDPKTHFHKLKRTSLHTCKQLLMSDIDYMEVSTFSKRCAQMFYGSFHGKDILGTHGGLVDIPTRMTPTSDMVRGVGGYADAELCAKSFTEKNPNTISVHGHRNMTNLPIRVTDNVFNINGDVDLGLRSVAFYKDGTIKTEEVFPSEETTAFYRENQLKKAKKFKAKKLSINDEGKGLMRLFQDHTYVDVKKLPNNIAAINFTRKAFEKGVWDDITIKARGLFAGVDTHDNPSGPNEIQIIARGYEKFFNLGERNGFELRDIRDMVFPIVAYEKANGYLGLLSVDNRDPKNPKWFISSKTTTEGDYADTFRKLIEPELTDDLMQKIIKDKVTLVFEVIEPTFDPHIEYYQHPELVLLNIVKNELEFKTLRQIEVDNYMSLFSWEQKYASLRYKRVEAILHTFNDFFVFTQKANNNPHLTRKGVEGYVFEDSSPTPNMFKLKTDWYSFWKYMRNIKNKIDSQVKRNIGNNKSAALTKSQLINLKKNLHTEEHIKVFNFMEELSKKDYDAYHKMSIIDVRNNMITKD